MDLFWRSTTLAVCLISIIKSELVFAENKGWVPINDHAAYFGPIGEQVFDFESAGYWNRQAQDSLFQKITYEQRIVGKAKNIVFFLGDGFGMTSVTTSRILKGQQVDGLKFGEEAKLYMDTLPFVGLSKTYCVDSQVADSACTSTAYLGGVKTNIGTIGVTSDVKLGNCTAQIDPNNHVYSILKWAQDAGKATGIVTTTRVTHASPAGGYANIADRDWEDDADMIDVGGIGANPDICPDIAEQLILGDTGKNINVILGGGRAKFIPAEQTDTQGNPGKRLDGQNLINAWLEQKKALGKEAKYLETRSDLLNMDLTNLDYLMGLFNPQHISYFENQTLNNEPRLLEMTQKAIEVLRKNSNGFVLFVEGGRIDLAHHQNWGLRALWEAIEFDRAIKVGDDLTEDYETLLVVSADHSHAFTMSGYPTRGNPIFGLTGEVAQDNMEYTTLGYANGPGYLPFVGEKRHDPALDPLNSLDYRYVPMVPLDLETHGGEDVAIFSKGPFAHLLTGVNEQNFIPHLMAYASCIGNGLKFCDKLPVNPQYYFDHINAMLYNVRK